ncbi:MAG: hypothetical protein J6T67_08905 [Paludibacteraceae bacterium]|nr:hypothetical protein [Paludibacteraceae bacterium]
MATFRGIACVACLVFSFGSAFAQEVSSSYAISKVEDSKPKKVEVVKTDEGIAVKTKNFSFKPYGFFRNDFYYDSRTNFETANGLFYIIPKDEDFNEEGQDMNGESSTNFLSIATRIGVRVTGPDFLKAKTLGVVEGDFAGCGSSPTIVRLRQAHFDLQWQKLSLIMGQTWHPMFGDVVPNIQSLATGSPFQPFNRSPQIRLNWQMDAHNRLFTSAIWQFQYTTTGPNGGTSSYMTKGKMPEFYLGYDWKKDGWTLGLGADVMRLSMPETVKVQHAGEEIPVSAEDHIASCSFDAYVQYHSPSGKLQVKAKSIYGGNMSHLLLLSGFGLADNPKRGVYSWTNVKNSTSWVDVVYGRTWKFGLFLGYMKNLGTDEPLLSESSTYIFGFNNLDYVYRIAPMVCYDLKHWSFGVEYERTTAAYGKLNLKDGRVDDSHEISNNRVVAILMYYF